MPKKLFKKDLLRKPAVKDLRIKLGHLYRTHQEYERAVKKTIQLTKEQVDDTLSGENLEEQKDLKAILEAVDKQREALADNYVYELKRLYRYLEMIPDSDLKLILTLRHVHFLTWKQIADCLGQGLTAKDVRKMHDQFIIESATGEQATRSPVVLKKAKR